MTNKQTSNKIYHLNNDFQLFRRISDMAENKVNSRQAFIRFNSILPMKPFFDPFSNIKIIGYINSYRNE